MPSMPTYFIAKGSQFGVLDGKYDGTDPEAYRNAQATLEGDLRPLGELAREHYNDQGLSEVDLNHFEEHWLHEWWRKQRVERVLRQGFLSALKLAQADDPDHPMPIEALWVCADEKSFHVYVNKGPRQVTVLVFTPPPKEHVPVTNLLEHEDIWVVKVEDKWDRDYWPEELVVRDGDENDADGDRIIERRLRYAPVASDGDATA